MRTLAEFGVDEVTFKITDVTTYAGFAENASDPKVEGDTKDDDYSFTELADDREESGTMEAKVTYAPFWAKDYGGQATVQVRGRIGPDSFDILTFAVPLDAGPAPDKLADSWEAKQVREWNPQFGASEAADHRFFAPDDDKELKDPDRADAGLPPHEAAGDSLTVFQEYRSYLLDGGGHDAFGGNAHAGGHTRLSPARKELLVERDIMEGMADAEGFPSVAAYAGIVNGAAAGFSDATNGAGLRMYWVADANAAGPAKSFGADILERDRWARANRNSILNEFVHLMFASEVTGDASLFGITSLYGSFVFVNTIKTSAAANGFDLAGAIPSTAAHELTHAIEDEAGNEHRPDADGNGTPDQLSDKRFMMYPVANPENFTSMLFDDWTRRHLNLTSKESVERA